MEEETTRSTEINNFVVKPTMTIDRDSSRGEYVIVVNPHTVKGFGIKKYAVVSCCREIDGENVSLCMHGRVIKDRSLKPNEIRIDQSLRHALGISNEKMNDASVSIWPLLITRKQILIRTLVRGFFGARYLFLRVASADVIDMEKNIARIDLDCFDLLGMQYGYRMIAAAPVRGQDDAYILKTIEITALGLTDEIKLRRSHLQEQRISARYPDAGMLLNLRPDLSPIYIDAHSRERLGVNNNPLVAVEVCRSVLNSIKMELLGVGTFVALSTIALTNTIKIFSGKLANFFVALLISLLVGLLLIAVQIRAKIK